MYKNNVIKIRKPAPNFCGEAYYKDGFKKISLKDFKGKYLLMFFYPFDFTFVCPTEIIAFSDRVQEFRKIGCEVVGISTDQKFCHMKYCETARDQGGLGKLNIMLISDIGKNISTNYGCLIDDENDEEYGASFRGTYIIDNKGILRHYSINDTSVGRNVDEYLRLIEAFIYTDTHDEVCQESWKPGNQGIKCIKQSVHSHNSSACCSMI
ncbi:unnamed protein product [Paramecium sonneborni]|uniref:Thioredoxin domain-containing protein n=1 Tax=Paramecium sonneborni TaxID=65129 RepID=A0A8S1QSQ3_9CILI|nr:unnamed protein product [Paramecium sonneborni]